MKTSWFYIEVVVLLGLLSSLIWIAFILKGNSGECLQEPLAYGARKLDEAYHTSVDCLCRLSKGEGALFHFNSNGSYLDNLLESNTLKGRQINYYNETDIIDLLRNATKSR